MKRLAFFAASVLLSIVSFADVVSVSTAKEAAVRYLGASEADYDCKELRVFQKADASPAFYVVNGKGKWAIIAADDCATPVIMHGDGTFNAGNIPDNVRSLLGTVEYDINEARRVKRPQDAEIKRKWTEVRSHLPRPVSAGPNGQVLLTTAKWAQSAPYNTKCPTIGGKATYAGCVAVAMAIIMRHHKWPETGTGTIPSYTYNNKTATEEEIDNRVNFDWESLPLTNAANSKDWTSADEWNDALKSSVADIIHRCGAMVRMDYGVDASGAITSDAKGAMATYMGYSKSARQLYRSHYTNLEWLNMIKSEIDLGNPLLYSGDNLKPDGTTGTGHAFVCDGYNSNDQIHINFGWGGSWNNWFAVCYLGPVGGEGANRIYSGNDAAVFGLVPDKASTSQPEIGGLRLYDSGRYSTEGLTISDGSIASGSTFNVTVSAVNCLNETTYSGKMSIALVDSDGAIIKIISKKERDITLPPGSYYHNNSGTDFLTFPCTLSSSDIKFGNRICMCYTVMSGGQTIDGENWVTTAGTSYNWSPGSNYIVGSIGVVDITTIEIPVTVSAGQNLYPGLSLGHKALSSVFWYLDSNSVAGNGYIDGSSLTKGLHTLKAVITYTDSSNETITRTFQVQ